MQSLQFAFRQLLKSPGFTAVSVASLALGIGACTAVFSLVNGVLLRSLPVPRPGELRVVHWTGVDPRPRSVSGHMDVRGSRSVAESVSPEMFAELREHGAPFAEIFGFVPADDVIARARQGAFTANGLGVTDNFFTALELRPLIGRFFAPAQGEEDTHAGHPLVITADWWERHFDRDPEIVGQTMTLNATTFTIIGVTPRGFSGIRPGTPRDFFAVLTPDSIFRERAVSVADHWWMRMMARIRTGRSATELKPVLDVVFARQAAGVMKNPEILLRPGAGGLTFDRENYGQPLLMMLGAVGLVLLVACANLAGLSLARAVARRHDLAVRAALGASRWSLIRPPLMENFLLAAFGCALGIPIAIGGRSVLSKLLSETGEGLPQDLSMDATVLGFALAATLVTALLSGVLPALRAGRADPMAGLKARNALDMARLRTGRILVVTQVSLSLLLLAGAGLFLRTLVNLRDIDAGFETGKLLMFHVNPGFAGYKDSHITAFYEEVQRSVAALPGARNAAVVVFPLLDNKGSSGGFGMSGPSLVPPERMQTSRLVISETFFATLGIPLIDGRNLSEGDGEQSPRVLVVNETFAKRFMPGETPIGRTIRTWGSEWQIVGVCGDTRYENIREAVPPTVYIPFRQFPLRFGAFFAVRTMTPPEELAGAVRRAVAAIDPAVPVSRLSTQDQLVQGTLNRERLIATLGAALAIFAVLLACIGLYGLMAFNVTRRTGEIAVRMTLGAHPTVVARSVLRESLLLTCLGVGFGLPALFVLTRFLRNQLYGVQSTDPLTLGLVILALLSSTCLAAWVPARRAARISPILALRAE